MNYNSVEVLDQGSSDTSRMSAYQRKKDSMVGANATPTSYLSQNSNSQFEPPIKPVISAGSRVIKEVPSREKTPNMTS